MTVRLDANDIRFSTDKDKGIPKAGLKFQTCSSLKMDKIFEFEQNR